MATADGGVKIVSRDEIDRSLASLEDAFFARMTEKMQEIKGEMSSCLTAALANRPASGSGAETTLNAGSEIRCNGKSYRLTDDVVIVAEPIDHPELRMSETIKFPTVVTWHAVGFDSVSVDFNSSADELA